MTNWRGAWSAAEATAYLEGATIPVRLACRTPSGGLWMLSLWFRHRDGAIHCATSAHADVVGYLEADPGVAFEVSDNDPPYRGVRGAGTASISPDEDKRMLEDLLDRYLGGTDNGLADRLLADDRNEVHVRIDPGTCYTWDFSDRMRDAVE